MRCSFILFLITPGCHVSDSTLDPLPRQLLLLDFQVDGQESLFFSNSQHSSSDFDGCFLPQCLQIGATLYFLCLSCLFLFFSLFVTLMLKFLFSLSSSIISFIASVVDLTRFSICWVWASVLVALLPSRALNNRQRLF